MRLSKPTYFRHYLVMKYLPNTTVNLKLQKDSEIARKLKFPNLTKTDNKSNTKKLQLPQPLKNYGLLSFSLFLYKLLIFNFKRYNMCKSTSIEHSINIFYPRFPLYKMSINYLPRSPNDSATPAPTFLSRIPAINTI